MIDSTRYDSEFAIAHLETLDAQSRLNDRNKALPNFSTGVAGLPVLSVIVHELDARKTSLRRSVRALIGACAAMHHAGVAAVSMKATHVKVRPIQVLQCGLMGVVRKASRGSYRGVGRIEVSGKNEAGFGPHMSPFSLPGYPCADSVVFSAGIEVFVTLARKIINVRNCYLWLEGVSTIEGPIEAVENGFRRGLANVPNQGAGTAGYVPAKNVTIC